MSHQDREIAEILVLFSQTEEHRALNRFMKDSTGVRGYKNFVDMIYNSRMRPEKKHLTFYRLLLKIKKNINTKNIKIISYDFSFLITLEDAYDLINYYIAHNDIRLTCIN